MKQLSIEFEPDVVRAYEWADEYVASRVHQQKAPQKTIAMEMDLSPSQLSRKLAPDDHDQARFTLKDFERYMRATRDMEPLKYLVAKHMTPETKEEIEAKIKELKSRLEDVA